MKTVKGIVGLGKRAFYIGVWMVVVSIGVGMLVRPEVSKYPLDDWWWSGVVERSHESMGGNQDIITAEGFYFVVRNDEKMTSGVDVHVLNAKSEDGFEMTFACSTKKRSSCKEITSVIRFPKATHTKMQGAVPIKL